MDEDEVWAEASSSARKFRWYFPIIRILAFWSSVFGASSQLFEDLAEDLANHANWKTERDEFRADASRELESLTETPKED